jgi:hypothetical protein
MKRCPCCTKVKAEKNFSLNRQTPDGLAYYCRECNAAKQREWKHANPDKVKRWKRRYMNATKDTDGE